MDVGTSQCYRSSALWSEQRWYYPHCLLEGVFLVHVGPDSAVPTKRMPQIGSSVDTEVERNRVKLQIWKGQVSKLIQLIFQYLWLF